MAAAMAVKGSCCILLLQLILFLVAKGSDIPCEVEEHLQLVNGSNRSEGRLNICHEEEWGSVCYVDTETGQLTFSNISADVACFQLGFAGALTWFKHGRFGPGNLNTWMKRVMCTGSETNITQCGTWCTTMHPCQYCDIHHFDVGISCIGEYTTCTDCM